MYRELEDSRRIDEAMSEMNSIWLDGRWRELGWYLHERVVMVFPGFAGAASGRDDVLAGFQDFVENAKLLDFSERDRRVDVIGDTAVASFAFEMTYERDGRTHAGGGRDLWVFERASGGWMAVWRTMLDMREEAVDGG